MASWRLTETAEQDIESLLSYLAEHHANRSFRDTAAAVWDHIERIAAHPLAFPVDERGVRHSVIPRLSYRVSYSYSVDVDLVLVSAVMHTSRRWSRS